MPLNDNFTFIAVDTETSGRYPIESEICEIAAVRFVGGQVKDVFSSLIKPQHRMSDEVIKIHGITNEMVANAPTAESVIKKFRNFIDETTLVAHHAPFDLGFIARDFEKWGCSFPRSPVICSSLLARQVITDSENHKLQTLIPHLGLSRGAAHRATDDAQACGELLLKCIERAKIQTLDEIWKIQNVKLQWQDFSLDDLRNKNQSLNTLVACMENRTPVLLKYGTPPGSDRTVDPIGLVRNPEGDYFVASDGDSKPKRFYLSRVLDIKKI